jgi:hypothetical protein
MAPRVAKQGLVWSGVLILVGVLSLLNLFVELSPWVWVLAFAAAGLGAFVLYSADRSDWSVLLAAYILWAIGLLIALVTLDILRDEAVAFFVLIVIALPFLGVYIRNRSQWWALIPAYVLVMVAIMVGLIGLGILEDALVASYVLFAIAIPFFVVYVRDRSQWWALIPGGILAVVGFALLIAEGGFLYIGGIALILIGAWILYRGLRAKEPLAAPEPPATPEPSGAPEPVDREDSGTGV